MARANHPTSRRRDDIGSVKFPIEVLLEARMARHGCLHVEAVLQTEPKPVAVIKSPSHTDVMGPDPWTPK
ncbi:MAG: hypothetical protein AAF495_05015 [Pseudomonadota bacterium]